MKKKLETVAYALKSKRKKVSALVRHYPHSLAIQSLDTCTNASPCFKEVCPTCMRTFRRSLLKTTRVVGSSPERWVRINIVLKGMVYQPGQLHLFNVKKVVKMLRKRIQRSELRDRLIIGGIDLSWNTLDNAEGHWQGHIYALISGLRTPALDRQIREVFVPSEIVPRPTSIKEIKSANAHFQRCLTYSYKAEFNWRSRYHEKRLKKDGSPRINRQNLPLPSPKLAEISDWLGHHEVGERLVITGLARVRSPQGRIKLRRNLA